MFYNCDKCTVSGGSKALIKSYYLLIFKSSQLSQNLLNIENKYFIFYFILSFRLLYVSNLFFQF